MWRWLGVLSGFAVAAGATAVASEALSGGDATRSTATIANGVATITRKMGDETQTVTVALPADVRFDGGDALLAAWDGKGTLTFDSFDIEAMRVERVAIMPVRGEAAGGRKEAVRRRYSGDALVAQSHLTLDSAGALVEMHQPMLGSDLLTRRADRDTALDYDAYRMFPNIMRKSPYRIDPAALAGHIRYRFGFKDGAAFAVPATGEQRVTVAGDAVQVDICAACGPGYASGKDTLAAALKPTLWLQSDNAKIAAVAVAVTKPSLSAAEKMVLLTAKTHDLVRRTNFSGHYSALEALERGSGDCTEEATLLAALGRAAGVPALVVNGIVYSRASYHGISNTFMPHSWVIAYVDGGWRSYDAALGDFDSTHIALTIGDGDAQSVAMASLLAGLLEWQGMAEVRSRPAP